MIKVNHKIAQEKNISGPPPYFDSRRFTNSTSDMPSALVILLMVRIVGLR